MKMSTRKESMEKINEASRESIHKDMKNLLLCLEGLTLFLLITYSKTFLIIITLLLFSTIDLATIYFLFFLLPHLSSTELSGFDGLLLFLLDGVKFLWSLHDSILSWVLNVAEYLVEIYNSEDLRARSEFIATLHHYQSTDSRGIDVDMETEEDWCLVKNTELGGIHDDIDEEGDGIKKLEKTRRLLKEFREEGKKMDIEMEFMEHMIHSNLDTHMKNLSAKLLELREELSNDGKKMKTYKKLMKKFGNSKLLTLKDYLSLNNVDNPRMRVDECSSSKAKKSVAEEVHETYLVIQETAKAAKTTAERVNLTYLAAQGISVKIKGEALEGFLEVREEVRRISLDFAARRIEAKAAAERAEKELSRATEELVEAVGTRQCDEYKTD